MNWVPRIEGGSIAAIHVKTGAKRVYRCGGSYGRPLSASVAGDQIAIQTDRNYLLLWDPERGRVQVRQ